MHRIDTPSRQKDKFGQGKDGFTNGDPQTGVPGTEVSAEFLDSIQEEIASVIEDIDSGAVLDKSKKKQLATAIKSIIRSAGMKATELASGTVKLATQDQTNSGTVDEVVVTPKKMRAGFSILLADSGYIALPTWLGGLVFQWTLSQIINSGANGTVLLPFSNPGGTIAAITTHENGSNDMPAGASYVGQIRSRAPGSVVIRNLGPQPAQFRIFTIGT
ncbi:hypothetical protein [Aeromonas hydrophila]|uniref:hypothetical protein n=1 Tax=Aeromonas hydrophila TaxID=644 RepID=UPI003EC589B4